MKPSVRRREIIESVQPTQSGRHIRHLDPSTGEVLKEWWETETDAPPTKRVKPPSSPDFFKVYRDNWVDIVRRKDLSPYLAGVFFSMLAFLDWQSPYLVHPETNRNLSVSGLADLMGWKRPTLHEAIQELNRKGLVAVVKRGDGDPAHLMLNSHIVHFGRYMRNQKDHQVFDNRLQPARPIGYKQPPEKMVEVTIEKT